MADVPRVEALNRIVALVQTMTGARTWDGITFTYPNVPQVTLGHAPIEANNYYPAFWIHSGERSALAAEAGQRFDCGTEAMLVDEYTVTIVGQFHDELGDSAQMWMQRGLWDLRHTLFSDTTLGGIVRDMMPGEERTDGGFYAQMKSAEFEQDVTVRIDEHYVIN